MTLRLFVFLALLASPMAALAADNEDNPYRNAKVGDFAIYSMKAKVATFAVDGTITQTVTAVTDKEVTVKLSTAIPGAPNTDQVQKIDITKPYDPTKFSGTLPPGTDASVEKDKEGKDKVKVGDKEYDCTWTTYKLKGKAAEMDINANIKIWMSKEAKMGMVKMEMNADFAKNKMEMNMVLKETGNKK
jgi:hypothetical protein